MMWRRILLGIFLFHLTLSQPPNVQYVLLVPSVLQENSLGKACAQLFNLTEPVVLTVYLNYGDLQTKILVENVAEENFFKCISFEVPVARSDPLAFIIFSAKGATLDLAETRSVAIRPSENVVLVQMDKPIYKPGQKLMFRVVSLDDNLKPVHTLYPVIFLMDPRGNRIQQWVNEESVRGIVQLSFQLISEPILGQYHIVVETHSEKKTYHYFSVEEYVLPKFQMTVDVPANILVVDHEFKINVCALYTYGKPVEGKLQLSVCRASTYYGLCSYPINSLCKNFTTELGKDGCISQFVNTTGFELNREGYRSYFEVHTLVTETGTGVQLKDYKYISIDSSLMQMRFENMDSVYKQGLPYVGQIKLLHPDDSPIPNEIIQLHLEDKIVGNFTTDINGTAQFSLDTSEITYPNITLKATYKTNENCHAHGWVLPQYPETAYFVRRFYSKTNSFLKIVPEKEEMRCNQLKQVVVHYLLNMKNFEDKTYMATFNYLVITKGVIILHGQKKVEISNNAAKGVFSISIDVSTELAPSAVLFVYTLHPGGEMVTDSTRIYIEKCFKNKVNLNFSEEKVHQDPISAFKSQLPRTLFVPFGLLMKVYGKLYHKELHGYYFKGLNLDDGPKEPCLNDEQILYNGIYYTPASADFGEDAYDLVKAMGLKVLSNSHLRKPVLCKNFKYPDYDDLAHSKLIDNYETSGSGRSYTEIIRKSFPETWVWNLITTDSTGVAKLPLTVPDTITQWKASGFCMNDEAGFGISATTSLTAFQPFFVELTLPYSVVRGEAFTLKANAFNYLNSCIQISTVLKDSSAYQSKLLSTEDENICICGNKKKSYVWLVTPHTLGTINLTVTAETLQKSVCGNGSPMASDIGWRDTLIKPLLVEPEGIEKEITQSSLICTNGSTVSQTVVLTLPENFVKDSSRAYWSVLGDILGNAMQNSQNLLHMPFGCGEQNMALFTPNIYIMDYLNQTQQLTEEIKSKGVGYLTTGYQRQLSYKHSDGSYSTFGHEDQQGNTWLTAFVYKSFAQAKRYIYIDDKVQSQTLIWLLNAQKSDGCFLNVGKVFNNALEGEEDDEISLTAYVTTALIEAGHPISLVAIQKGLQCLDVASRKRTTTTYDQALLAYTFGLAGQEDKREFFLNELSKKAKKVGGSIYWELEENLSREGLSFYYPRASSAQIEMTSYGLLALLSKRLLTSEELSYASQITQWVAKQQNSYGGFSSTKDTIVALQALTLFQRLTFTKNRQNSVQISNDQAFNRAFSVNDENRLLLQRIPLPTTKGKYTVEVNGIGCVYVQSTVKYNILLPKKSSGFSLSVNTANAFCEGVFETRFDLVISASYNGRRNTSNMAIIDVKMLSGFVPDKSSIEKLQGDGKVQRVEVKNTHVFFYLENVTQKEIQLSFSIEQEVLVSNMKPASIQLYDYYETDEFALAEYNTPCNKMSFETS